MLVKVLVNNLIKKQDAGQWDELDRTAAAPYASWLMQKGSASYEEGLQMSQMAKLVSTQTSNALEKCRASDKRHIFLFIFFKAPTQKKIKTVS